MGCVRQPRLRNLFSCPPRLPLTYIAKRLVRAGRGAIQTTGPNNYGLLQRDVIAHVPQLAEQHVDLCTNPEAVCEHADVVWLGALLYWANDVQGFSHAPQAQKCK